MIENILQFNQEHLQDKEDVQNAGDAVLRQLAEYPALGLPVDPDVADELGAFAEPALSLDELDSPEEFAANLEGHHE